MDSYLKIEAVINLVEGSPPLNPEIESLLGARLVLLVFAAYEVEFERIFSQRADTRGDIGLAAYCKHAFGKSFRNPSFEEIKNHMERLAQKEWKGFRKVCSDQEITQWDELVKARHTLAHTPTPGFSFATAKSLYNATQNVLRKLETSFH